MYLIYILYIYTNMNIHDIYICDLYDVLIYDIYIYQIYDIYIYMIYIYIDLSDIYIYV